MTKMPSNNVSTFIEMIRTCELGCIKSAKKRNFNSCVVELRAKKFLLEKLKRNFQRKNDEKTSNCLLLEEFITHGDISFFESSRYLTMGKFGKCWDELQTVLNYYGFAVEVAEQIKFRIKETMVCLDKCKDIIEQFPQQYFMSPEILIKRRECSICGKNIRNCSHIKGRVYNGKYCTQIVKGITISGASLTDNPLDPRCRVVPVGEDYDKGWYIEDFSKKMKKEIMTRRNEMQSNILTNFGTFTTCF